MSRLNLPTGATAGFRLELWDAWGNRFTMNIYGAGRRGWFLARRQWSGNDQSIGPEDLARGQWREFLGYIKQAGFWELPERFSQHPNLVTDDGEWIILAVHEDDHYHEVHRDGYGSPMLFQDQRFLTHLSGLFSEPMPY